MPRFFTLAPLSLPWISCFCLLLPTVLWLNLASLPAQEAPPKAEPMEEEPPRTTPPPETRKPAKKNAEQDLFDFANLQFAQKSFATALGTYQKYLDSYASGKFADYALFQIGDCHWNLNESDKAEACYKEVISKYAKGEPVSAAAYRLAMLRYFAKDYENAAPYFSRSADQALKPSRRADAAFFNARCLQLSGKKAESIAAYKIVGALDKENQYREEALSALGALQIESGDKAGALATYLLLSTITTDSELLGEALVKSALIYMETGKSNEAIGLYERAIKIPGGANEWRRLARLGLTQALYSLGDYDGVIRAYMSTPDIPVDAQTPQMVLLIGNAYRKKQDYRSALEMYSMVDKYFPQSEEAVEAGYYRLLSLFKTDDQTLTAAIGKFLDTYQNKYAGHETYGQFIDMARLLKAENAFKKQLYPEAGQAFSAVNRSNIPEHLRAPALFKQGWSEGESKNFTAAISTLSKYLEENPKSREVARGLARRAIAYQELRDFANALKDYDRLMKEYPGSEPEELAYQQSAIIKGQQKDYAGMVKLFEEFIKKFPTSPARAEAYWWIGWALFEQKEYLKAVPPLRKSIDINSKGYQKKAGMRIMLSFYYAEDADKLAAEVESYLVAQPGEPPPPRMMSWLGIKFFERLKYEYSARYFGLAVTPNSPADTDPLIWNYLAMSQLKLNKFEESLKSIEHCLEQTPELDVNSKMIDKNILPRAGALLIKAKALLGLKKFTEARQTVGAALTLVQSGRLQGQLLICLGDIARGEGAKLMAEGGSENGLNLLREAAAKYFQVAQLLQDPEVTPEALQKLVEVFELLGEKARAAEARRDLDQWKQEGGAVPPKSGP